jgi:hypothetical protein
MSRLLLSISFVSLLACGGSSPARVTTTPADPAPVADTGCPMDVAGTSVTAEDTPTGGALVFVTTGDVAKVRAHIAAWADVHNQHHGAMGPLPTGEETPAPGGGGHDHHHHGAPASGDHAGHGGGGGTFQTMISVHSRATAADIDGGVRLELITFPDQVGALRDELRGHVAHLAGSGCSMEH